MKRRSIETSVLKEPTSAPYFVRTRPGMVSGTVTLRPIKRRPKTRESLRNSVSLGNLDTIEEWPEPTIVTNARTTTTGTLNSLRRKKSLSKTISKVSKSLLTYSRTAVAGSNQLKQPTQVQCLPKIKFNPKIKSGVSSMRRAIKKISMDRKRTDENSPKKTPILAQREIIVDNGITIWEEEMTNAEDSFDFVL